MCGLVGVANFTEYGIYQKHFNLFENLLIVDSIRGSDGTGVLGIDSEGTSKTIKIAGDPYKLFSAQGYEKVTDFQIKPYLTVLAGHNRYATKGSKNSENAHPFSYKNTILMHNGTLYNYEKTETNKNLEVDSNAFAHLIEDYGLHGAVERISGAFAIVCYNTKDKTLSFARNKERPLYLLYSKSKPNSLIWGSEMGFLTWLNNRHKVIDDPIIEELEEMKELKINLSPFKITLSNLPLQGGKLYSAPKNSHVSLIQKFTQKKNEILNKSKSKIKSLFCEDISLIKPEIVKFSEGDSITFMVEDIIPVYAKGEIYRIIGCLNENNVIVEGTITGKELAEVFQKTIYAKGKIKKILAFEKSSKKEEDMYKIIVQSIVNLD